MIRAVLFDLGNTLAEYYTSATFTRVLKQAVAEVEIYLDGHGLIIARRDDLWTRVQAENHEARNHRVRPLEARLTRIFGVRDAEHIEGMCRAFLKPTFALGRCYEDSVPVLQELRAKGVKTAIVSNAPWGSPARLWREELGRLGLADCVDHIAICTDVGWRKPAKPIFLRATHELGVMAEDCLFVGDHPGWDLAGARRAGIRGILINREGERADLRAEQITGLRELFAILDGVSSRK